MKKPKLSAKKPAPKAKSGEQDPKPDEQQAFRIMEAENVGAENYRKPIYKREEIAPIAARLLDGDITKAVEQAIRLLAECDKQIREAEKANKISALALEKEQAKGMSPGEIQKLNTQDKWRLGFPVQIGELAKWITGKVRPDRARQSLRERFEEIAKEHGVKSWTPGDRAFWDNFLKLHWGTEYNVRLRPMGMDAISQEVHLFLGLKWRDEERQTAPSL
jgi:hypothetical protein